MSIPLPPVLSSHVHSLFSLSAVLVSNDTKRYSFEKGDYRGIRGSLRERRGKKGGNKCHKHGYQTSGSFGQGYAAEVCRSRDMQ